MELTCPKCHGTMRTYERNGVHVDQCTECRGIFLDRGELERLIDAEDAWHGGGRPAGAASSASGTAPAGYGGPGHGSGSGHGSAGGYGAGGLGAVVGEVLSQVQKKQQHSSGYGHSGKRKQSFLGELFG
ncbi:zf-TFIIB domain-containing protein [Geodermatophilus sp. DSM 44513]|uniref:TFIIB-type zinc ribbon-containing protein n=1 Tax=Geodermatophilus sp. DSM 44513 TaxID=1528104 RepID=UPI00126F55E4|nr:zf-TFIIB domain-containing protein [Geodermatophilus sp. DSM 44513]WNV73783.1 zf-TFIIB domain-containing protein [Geodermatophilus sp. DSM 44513]